MKIDDTDKSYEILTPQGKIKDRQEIYRFTKAMCKSREIAENDAITPAG